MNDIDEAPGKVWFWDFCPRGGLQYERTWKITGNGDARTIEGIGKVHESYTARIDPRIEGAQDGGFVSAFLISLLEAGEIDGALVARESVSERWKGEAFLATTSEEVVECA